MRIAAAAWNDAEVQRLAAAQQVELRARYDGGGEPGTPPSTADISVVLVAYGEDEAALGCGALRALGTTLLSSSACTWPRPTAARRRHRAPRGAGGCRPGPRLDDLRLETGPRQPEAVALYTRAGYRPITAFGAYAGAADAADSLFFERRIDRPRRARCPEVEGAACPRP